MLQALISHRLISPPAIWGKLSGHADFVRSGVRHGEGEGWQSWLAAHAALDAVKGAALLPAALVLPPGSLAFAPGYFVLGVVVPSADRTGRRHALLVYQRAHARWVRRHFEAQADHPRDWLFWLARAVGRHGAAGATGELQVLERTVHALWQLHRPALSRLGRAAPAAETAGTKDARSQVLLDRLAGLATVDDAAGDLSGVRHLPWAGWPARLHGAHAQSVFWQQDAAGGFVNAGTRLADIWRTES
ncbi:type VI secretion system-associated protein TagF [Variovorax ureilyticus]|uniref:Type VI secretion system-associated protein TagF n=1 Tax=Variovorax ureilyticus TaxID=1836198 RepID=A0ABU8VAL7_9BURK